MSTEILAKLFSSMPLVKMMRLFINNQDQSFDKKDIVKRCKIRPESVQVELNLLKSIGMIKPSKFFKLLNEIKKTSNKKTKVSRKKVSGWIINKDFQYLNQLNSLLVNTDLFTPTELRKRFKNAGKIKVLAISRVFMQEDGRIDLLIVGDNLNKKSIEKVIKNIEAEIGNEIIYVIFDTKEFVYRIDMHDKLISDIFDFPHIRIIDTLKYLT